MDVEATGPVVLVVVNSPNSGLRRFAPWLRSAKVELDIRYGGDGLPGTLDRHDGLIMLGGGLMPDDYDRAPWLRQERELAEQAMAMDIPVLGICLGGQLLADVGGGEVRRKHGVPERGATRIELTEQGRDDAVMSVFAPATYLIENHEDMITALPSGATLLASSTDCTHQAFRIGQHVRGVQFHPEAGAQDLRKWDDAALREKGLSRDDLVNEALFHDVESSRRCEAFATAFAREIVEIRARNTAKPML